MLVCPWLRRWVKPEDVELPPEDAADEEEHVRQLKAVGRQQNKCALLPWAAGGWDAVHLLDERGVPVRTPVTRARSRWFFRACASV